MSAALKFETIKPDEEVAGQLVDMEIHAVRSGREYLFLVLDDENALEPRRVFVSYSLTGPTARHSHEQIRNLLVLAMGEQVADEKIEERGLEALEEIRGMRLRVLAKPVRTRARPDRTYVQYVWSVPGALR